MVTPRSPARIPPAKPTLYTRLPICWQNAAPMPSTTASGFSTPSRTLAVVLGIGAAFCQQIGKRVHNVGFAGGIRAGERGVTIGRRIALPWRQAAITFPRHPGGFRIHFVEIVENRADRIVEAVKIKAMKRDAIVPLHRRVVLAQPAHEIAHLVVSPHPSRKPRERRPFRRWILEMPHVMIDACGVGPIAVSY